MPESTLLEMISLLGFSVDFQREIRSGDSFEVLFTKEIDILSDLVTQTKPIKYVSMNLSGNKLIFLNMKINLDLHNTLTKMGNLQKEL